jgi:endonuclease III
LVFAVIEEEVPLQACNMASSIRKVSEDVKLRPFLSTHFDSQTYIKTVIKEGRSEECFNNVATCIEEVNEEIKAYISQNKDVLMSGMQDVALLSERYSLLYSTSQKLQRNVDRLKKEVFPRHNKINLNLIRSVVYSFNSEL